MQKKGTSHPDELAQQIGQISEAMKKAGVWSSEIPAWLDHHKQDEIPDIWQWLQYIYLPMRLNGQWFKPHYIAPVIGPYLNTTPELKRILQLVIELDSLSSTFDKN
jgi:hypothetical protein